MKKLSLVVLIIFSTASIAAEERKTSAKYGASSVFHAGFAYIYAKIAHLTYSVYNTISVPSVQSRFSQRVMNRAYCFFGYVGPIFFAHRAGVNASRAYSDAKKAYEAFKK